MALSCIRPQVWQKWREAGHSDTDTPEHRLYMSRIAGALNITHLPGNIANEKWMEVGMVNTTTESDFPDVRQFIDLIVWLADALSHRQESIQKPELPQRAQPDWIEQTATERPTMSKSQGKKRKRDDAEDGEPQKQQLEATQPGTQPNMDAVQVVAAPPKKKRATATADDGDSIAARLLKRLGPRNRCTCNSRRCKKCTPGSSREI